MLRRWFPILGFSPTASGVTLEDSEISPFRSYGLGRQAGALVDRQQETAPLIAQDRALFDDLLDQNLPLDRLALEVSLVVDEDHPLGSLLGVDERLEVQIRKR